MVVPHDTGDLVRSLVRVPGSGSNLSAGSECLNLGRVSNLAASVNIPSTLPPELIRRTSLPPSSLPFVNDKLNHQEGVPNNRKRRIEN